MNTKSLGRWSGHSGISLLLLSSDASGLLWLQLRIQHYLQVGILGLGKGIALGTAGVPSDLRLCLRLRLSRHCCQFGGLLSQRGRLEAAAELDHFSRKWRMTCDNFWATVKCSAKPPTAVPNSPVGETRESRKAVLCASLISI